MGKIPSCDKEKTVKGAWSKAEDERLINHIQHHGEGNWRSVSQAAGLNRCGKSCRLRWMNYLRPGLKKGSFTENECALIVHLHNLLGNKWSQIAATLPGRTDNEVKNYWNCHLKRQLFALGIDPVTHQPLNVGAAVDPQANSQVSGVTAISEKGTSDITAKSTKQINYFNEYLNTKVQVSNDDHEYSGGGDGEGSSNNGVSTTNTQQQVRHSQLNLELSLAPPSQPEDDDNFMHGPQRVETTRTILCPGHHVNVSLGL